MHRPYLTDPTLDGQFLQGGGKVRGVCRLPSMSMQGRGFLAGVAKKGPVLW